MVEAGTRSLPAKIHPEKKNRNQKNSTVRDKEFDSLSLTVEFFDLRIFSLGEVLLANFC
jgi:hypothetical protein